MNQILGKDILRFHAIYWPAFLMAANLKLPNQILCHGHWLVDNRKMSKSTGNVIDPFDCLNKYTLDGMRYFLLREGLPDNDCNISEEKFTKFINAELANTLGNLYSRIIPFKNYSTSSFEQIKPYLDQEDKLLILNLNKLREQCDIYYNEFNFYLGIQLIMSNLRTANNLVHNYKPWILIKGTNESDSINLKKLLFLVCESLRISGILLQPIVPDLSDNLLNRLNVKYNERFYKNAIVNLESKKRNVLTDDTILFKRLK